MRPPASSSSFSSFTHDVFLSFRGADTRNGFTGNLYNALDNKGIRTFIDDEELQKGEEITEALLKAIEESMIAIVVISKDYASSTFCLKELVKILECFKPKGRLIWPVFYEVDPGDVRHIQGSFKDAMAKHDKRFGKNTEVVEKWKLALREVADLSGSHFRQRIEYEYKFIQEIVSEISRRKNLMILPITDYSVGMESRMQRVDFLLDVGFNGVIMVGIYGIGGVGKTTIARAIYNKIAYQFDDACFLGNVRDNSSNRSLVQLQEIMLSELAGEKDIKLADACKGSSIIESRLNRKKILLVLDDVNELHQLKNLAGGRNWFGPGSRIIITTRDEHLLSVHGVERKYEAKTLSHEEARQLFTWKAFKGKDFDPSYVDILDSLVLYCGGLPLALEVIGSNLFDKSLDEWQSAFHTYEIVPEKSIQKILKTSYDDLENTEKRIFLDLACFFKGCRLDYVKTVVSSRYGMPPEYSIGKLIDRSLVRIDPVDGIVWMHDLIEDMGKEIVRNESPDPSKQSRLWLFEDIRQVLQENMGTRKIEAIVMHSNGGTEVQWDGNGLMKMTNLQMLIIKNVSFTMGPEYLPSSLRYLEWEEYGWQALPRKFCPEKLAILSLKGNCLASFQSLLRASRDYLAQKIIIKSFSEIANQGQVKGSENKGKGKSIMEQRNEGPSELWSEHAESNCDSINTDPTDDEGYKGLGIYRNGSWNCIEEGQWFPDSMSESGECSGEVETLNDISEVNDGEEEARESDDEVEAKRIAGTCNNISEVNDEVDEVREGDNIVRTCGGNNEINERHEGCSWFIGFAIQLLRCLPLPEKGKALKYGEN